VENVCAEFGMRGTFSYYYRLTHTDRLRDILLNLESLAFFGRRR
jgi:hypothetical protein